MSTLIAEFTVVGTPVPQGSARAFAGKGKAAGRAFLTNDPTGSISKWRGDIRSAIGVVATERDVRIDGKLKADARVNHAGVEVSFEVPDGRRLTFHTDAHTGYQVGGKLGDGR